MLLAVDTWDSWKQLLEHFWSCHKSPAHHFSSLQPLVIHLLQDQAQGLITPCFTECRPMYQSDFSSHAVWLHMYQSDFSSHAVCLLFICTCPTSLHMYQSFLYMHLSNMILSGFTSHVSVSPDFTCTHLTSLYVYLSDFILHVPIWLLLHVALWLLLLT